jgi:hypothetical protein
LPHDSSTDEMSFTAVFKSDSALCACANKHKQIGRSIGNQRNCCAAYHFVGRRLPTRTQLTPEFAIVLQTEKNEKQTTKVRHTRKKKRHIAKTPEKKIKAHTYTWMHTEARAHTDYIRLTWLPVKDTNTIRTCPVSFLHCFNLVGCVWNTDY